MAGYVLYAVMGDHILFNALRKRCDTRFMHCAYWSEAEEAIREEIPSLLIMSYIQIDAEAPSVIELLRDNPVTRDIPIALIIQRSPDIEVERAMQSFESETVIAKLPFTESLIPLIALIKAYSE